MSIRPCIHSVVWMHTLPPSLLPPHPIPRPTHWGPDLAWSSLLAHTSQHPTCHNSSFKPDPSALTVLESRSSQTSACFPWAKDAGDFLCILDSEIRASVARPGASAHVGVCSGSLLFWCSSCSSGGLSCGAVWLCSVYRGPGNTGGTH
jgi:hypothetical protein